MARKPKLVANLRVGKPHTHPAFPTHVRGIRQGNRRGNIDEEKGIHPDEDDARFASGSAERSTGINARARNPVDPRMPNLSPS